MPPSNSIFISYRRRDSNDVTGRIYDRLAQHFGRDVIFRDIHSIPYGIDFRTHIKQEVGRCQVLIAVVGSEWLKILQERMDQPQDWVRTEIEIALERAIPVIPLLVGGAQPPNEEQLPDTLKELAHRNAAQARHDPDFHQDMTRLIRRLEKILELPESSIPGKNQSLLKLPSNQPNQVDLPQSQQSNLLDVNSADSLMIQALKKQHHSLSAQFDAVADELLFADQTRAVQLELHRDSLSRRMQKIEQQLRELEDGTI